MYCVIMAGGSGTRFWPLSRKDSPKQLLNIIGGNSMLQMTVDRLRKIKFVDDIFIVTRSDIADKIIETIKRIPKENIIVEPSGKNTAPCIGLSALHLEMLKKDSVMGVFPADHLIVGHLKFEKALKTANKLVQKKHSIATIGIKPTHPSTAYGYIQHTKNEVTGQFDTYHLKTFAEKPHLNLAKRFIKSGDFLWNSGMFIWSVNSIITSIKNLLPEMHDVFSEGTELYNTLDEFSFINRVFPTCRNISIDYGIMEKSKNVFVYPSDFGWSDLGTWGSLSTHVSLDKNDNTLISKQVLLYDSENNIVRLPKDKAAVIQGLDGYIIVDTKDALLICKKEEEQKIKQFVADVKYNLGDNYV